MEKVVVAPDESLDRHYPEAWPARIELRTGSGRLVREVGHTKGDPSDPMGWDDVRQKVGRLVRGIADQASVDRLAAVCRDLGAGTRLADLLTTLSAITPPARPVTPQDPRPLA